MSFLGGAIRWWNTQLALDWQSDISNRDRSLEVVLV